MRVVHVTDEAGRVLHPGLLERAEGVHRQLRGALLADYAAKMARVFAGGGRMIVAAEHEQVHGAAVFRIHENTSSGLHLYVDDLVTDEALRSRGIGRLLLAECERVARERGCRVLALDSGTQRREAHRFYFREGMTITAFHFGKQL
ncbi:MAG TPA: GNAT family N-acetyltransferase [Burkholderiales bacterium]|nr:GNAT family N-acetyltransferase [Burkholderiales bacterium]